MDIKGNLKVEGQLNLPQLDNEKVVVTDNSGNVVESVTTSTEIGYVSGVTSSIQTQLNDTNTRIDDLTTDEVAEGIVNKYYSSTLFDADLATKSTDDLSEGITNLYFTDNRAQTAAVVNSTAGSETNQAASVDAMKTYVSSEISNNSANRTLSNLTSPTAINQDLLPDGPGRNLGNVNNEFDSVFAQSVVTDIVYDGTLVPRISFPLDSTIIESKGNGDIILDPAGTGSITVNNNKIKDVTDPTLAQDAATKNYTDTTFIPLTQKGSALGVATLDGAGKVPLTQLPAAIMTYEGVWNAATNTPALADGVGDTGMVYRVGTAGTQNLGSGPITFDVGDYVIYNGTVWEKSDTTDAVASVNGFTGVVNLDTDDIPEGTNKYYSSTLFDSDFASKTTDNLTQGVVNKYYSSTLFDADLATKDTDNLAEGTSNLYFTDSRVLAALPQDIATTATPQFQDIQVLGPGLGNRLVGKTLALASSTGAISGMVLSINAGDPSKFDITAGTGEVVDLTNVASPVVTPVTFAGATAQTVTNLVTSPVTYISITAAGTIYQQTTYPTPVERRQRIFIGRLNHSNNVVINFANTFPDYKLSFVSQYYDLLDALAPFKIGGMTVSPNGTNLSFNKAAGTVFFRSNNYAVNNQNPHISSYTGQIPQPFRKITRSATVDVSNVTVIDPVNYDNGGVVTAVGGAGGRSTIQRIYQYKSGDVRIAYGQNVYNNLSDALAALNSDSFIPNSTIEQTAILIGYIVVRHTATNLSDPAQARIITAARFDAGGSVAAGGITSLQQAYNNSTLPQIVLTSASGAVTIDDNATPLGTDLFQVRSNVGNDYFAVSAANTSIHNTVDMNLNSIQQMINPTFANDATNKDYVDNKTDPNFILNGTAEQGTTGWTTYNNGAVSRPTTGTGGSPTITFDPSFVLPLSGQNSFLLTKTSGSKRGQGASYDFTIDSASKTQMLKIEFDYEVASGTFATGTATTDSDLIVYLYDVTNTRLIEPTTFKLYSFKDRFTGYFQTSADSNNYRLIFHITTTSSAPWDLRIDNVKVNRSSVPVGAIVTDWQNYTPTFSTGGGGTLPTRTIDYAQWMQVGSNAYYRGKITFTGTGTWNGPQFTLPPGHIIKDFSDITILPSTVNMVPTGVGTNRANAYVWAITSSIMRLATDNGSGPVSITQAAPFSWASGNSLSWDIGPIPIQGWSSGARLPDGYDGREVVGLFAGLSSALSITTSNQTVPFISVSDSTASYSSGVFTVKSSGWYLAEAGIGTTGLTGTSTVGTVVTRLTLNIGSQQAVSEGVAVNTTSSSSIPFLKASKYAYLSAGQTIFVQARTSGSTTGQLSTFSDANYLSITKLSGSFTYAPLAAVAEHWAGTDGDAIGTSNSLIKFTTKVDSTHGAYNPATGIFTAPETGKYQISWLSTINPTLLSTSERFLAVAYKNGAPFKNGKRSIGNGASINHDSSGSFSVNLNQGETISIYGISSVSSSLVTSTSGCYLSIVKVSS